MSLDNGDVTRVIEFNNEAGKVDFLVRRSSRLSRCKASMDGKFCIQIESDWPLLGQICDIFRSDSVHFGAPRLTVIMSDLTLKYVSDWLAEPKCNVF